MRIDYSDVMRKPRFPAVEDIKADFAASEMDIAAGRVVSGRAILDRIQAALDRYEMAKNTEAESRCLLRR